MTNHKEILPSHDLLDDYCKIAWAFLNVDDIMLDK
jgi:hypothetical protein